MNRTMLCLSIAAAGAAALYAKATTATDAAHLIRPASDVSAVTPQHDYTVFVDPPTGFVFVKLPQGWKFAGRVGQEDLARLPSSVVTALLAPSVDDAAAERAVAEAEALKIGAAVWP
jgi:hypothetical protein